MTDDTGPLGPPDGAPSPGPTTGSSRRALARRRARRRRLVIGAAFAVLVIAAATAGAVVALASGGSGRPARRTVRTTPPSTVSVSTTTSTAASGTSTPTTVVPKSSNPIVALAQQYDGAYQGTFTNATFHTTGTALLKVRVDPVTGDLAVTVDLTGDLFGGGAKAPRQIQGTVKLGGDPNAPVTTQSPTFGTVTGRLGPGLSVVLTAPNIPDPKVQSFELTGKLRDDQKGFDATFTVGLRNGATAQGTATVLCASTGQRPTAVGTICST